MLDIEPKIVHFSGHGGPGGLALEDDDGQARFIHKEALSSLFKLFKDKVECVLLNACYSQDQAEGISEHINYVIGMSKEVSDKAALEFAVGFYDAIGAGRSIEDAFEFGRNAIQSEGITEHSTPQMLRRVVTAPAIVTQPNQNDSSRAENPQSIERRIFGGQAISQTMAMLFVDLMRLLYVASSDVAKGANVERYVEFIRLADQHFDDLRSRIAASSVILDAHSHKQIDQLELRLSWMLGRLKNGPNLSGEYRSYFTKMMQIGTALHELCLGAAGEHYQSITTHVEENVERSLKQSRRGVGSPSLNETFLLRLKLQTELLSESHELENSSISTIADDMDQDFAIRYFVLDYQLLRVITGNNSFDPPRSQSA